jgi:hypothetical protein
LIQAGLTEKTNLNSVFLICLWGGIKIKINIKMYSILKPKILGRFLGTGRID